MNSTITLCENTFDPRTWTTHENVSDVCAFLFDHFQGQWPVGAHVYLDHVASNSDITPYDDAGVRRLETIEGHFFVVVYPQDPISLIIAVVAIVISAVAVGLAFLLRPSIPKSTNYGSPNNALAARENTARPNQRIPDIFGQLWATFDLLAVPYRTFVNNIEIEHCYMCIGRGDYDIAVVNGIVQIRDDITPIAELSGATVQVYGSNTSPNSGSPYLTVGTPITEPVVNLQVFSSVNGQILNAPNLGAFGVPIAGPAVSMRFKVSGGIAQIQNNSAIDWTLFWSVGDSLVVGGFNRTGYMIFGDDIATDGTNNYHMGAYLNVQSIYSVTAVTTDTISLGPIAAAAAINPAWNNVATMSGGASNYTTATAIMGNGSFFIGPFWLNYPQMTHLWSNFVAPQSIFLMDSSSQYQQLDSVTVALTYYPCDTSGTPTGPGITSSVTLYGNRTDRLMKGATLKVDVIPGTGGIVIMATRTSNAPPNVSGKTFQDQTQWRDCYVISDVCSGAVNFGNVTTIQSVIPNTPSALAVKARKLNALVTRKIPVPTGGSIAASTNAADIICAMALDPFIGKLQTTDLDITNIYAVAGAGGKIQTYFSVVADPTKLTQFCYTFDDDKISFEESIVDVANAIMCVAYRRGGLLSLSFEKQTSNSTLLFNHRNKIPKTETRTITFGTVSGNDGIVLSYVEPNAPNYPNVDTTVNLYFPISGSATNPRKFTAIGVRNIQQAMVMGWRLYQKLLGQNCAVQFEATEEAALLVLQDRILVADNTRPDTQDGEVIAQVSLLLTLSQNVVFVGGRTYTIFLQHPDETVESIAIIAGPNPNQVTLATAPLIACVTDQSNFAKTTYMIVSNVDASQTAFLLQEKQAKNGKTFEIKAVNYSDSYYQHDLDLGVSIISVPTPCGAPGGFAGCGNLAALPALYLANSGVHYATRVAVLGANISTPSTTSSDSIYISMGGFFNIVGITKDSAGNLYVANVSNNGVVYKVSPSCGVTRIAGTVGTIVAGDGGAALSAILSFVDDYSSKSGAITCDAAGNVYISSSDIFNGVGGTIRAINMQSTTQTLFGVSIAPGNIDRIAGTTSASGFSGDGGAARSAKLNVPAKLQIDPSGNLLIADTSNNRIRMVTPSGIISTIAGTGTSGESGDGGAATAAQVRVFDGIVLDAAGNIYFPNRIGNVIRAINRQSTTQTLLNVSIAPGNIAIVAGTLSTSGFSGDGGQATSAQITVGAAITCDSLGNIYFYDSGNNRVRKIATTGIITTVVGNGTSGVTGDGGSSLSAEINNITDMLI